MTIDIVLLTELGIVIFFWGYKQIKLEAKVRDLEKKVNNLPRIDFIDPDSKTPTTQYKDSRTLMDEFIEDSDPKLVNNLIVGTSKPGYNEND